MQNPSVVSEVRTQLKIFSEAEGTFPTQTSLVLRSKYDDNEPLVLVVPFLPDSLLGGSYVLPEVMVSCLSALIKQRFYVLHRGPGSSRSLTSGSKAFVLI